MNALQELTIFTEAAFVAASFLAPKHLAAKDAIQIQANGSLDSLKSGWHRVNVEIRFLMFFTPALIAVAPAAIIGKHPFLAVALMMASLALNASFHWLVFDRELNRLRGLAQDYLGQNAKLDAYAAKHPRAKIIVLGVSALLYAFCLLHLIKNLE